MHRLTRVATVTAVLLAPMDLGSSSCAGRPSPHPREAVRVVALPFLSQIPFHIAEAEGYFDEQGLDVEFLNLSRNQDVMTALAHGDVDAMGGMLTLNELSLMAAGARVRVVGALTARPPPDGCTQVAIMIRKAHLDSGAATDPDRIRRMRFDVNRFIPLGYAVDEWLGTVGLSLDEVETVDLTPAVAVEAMRTGEIDVTVDSEPYLTLYEEHDAAVWRSVYDILPDYVHSVVMFGPTLLDERPGVGNRLMIALLKGIRQYRLGKTPRNLEIVRTATGLTAEEVARACWPTPPEDGRVDAAAFRPYEQWSVQRGLLGRLLADDDLVDQRFIVNANAALAR